MKKQSLLILALASLTALSVAQSPQPPPTPTESAKEEQHAGPSEKLDSDSPQQSIAGPTEKAENIKPKSSERGGESSTDWWIAAFTGVLTLVGIVQLVAMFKQASYMRRGLDATNKAADAATVSANVATQALKDSKEVLLLTERALVKIEKITLRKVEGFDGYIHKATAVNFILKNFGRTVAHAVKVTGKLVVGDKEQPLGDMPEIMIAPEGLDVPTSRSLGTWLDDAEISSIERGKTILCYEIKATYRDIFKIEHVYTASGVWSAGFSRFHIRTDNEIVI